MREIVNLKNVLDRKIIKKIYIPQPIPMKDKISNKIIRKIHQVHIWPKFEEGHGWDPRRFPNINKIPLQN
jgi:hypothetical protein